MGELLGASAARGLEPLAGCAETDVTAQARAVIVEIRRLLADERADLAEHQRLLLEAMAALTPLIPLVQALYTERLAAFEEFARTGRAPGPWSGPAARGQPAGP